MTAYATREPILEGFLLDGCSGEKFARPTDVDILPDGCVVTLVNAKTFHTYRISKIIDFSYLREHFLKNRVEK